MNQVNPTKFVVEVGEDDDCKAMKIVYRISGACVRSNTHMAWVWILILT